MNTTDTDLTTQVARLRADLERVRLDTTVTWVTRTGRTRHLIHEGLTAPARAGQASWTFCGADLDDLTPAEPGDDRSVCLHCERERRDYHHWQQVQAERRVEEWRIERERSAASFARTDDSIESIEAITESLRELRRARDIRRGVDPDRPEETTEEIRARTIALRARNDQALAEMQGRSRTSD